MSKFTPSELRDFRVDFANAVKQLEAKYKINIALGNIRYGDIDFTVTLKAKRNTPEAVEKVEDRKRSFWNAVCESYGLTPEDFGKTIVVNGLTYTLSEINPRSTKYPITIAYAGQEGVHANARISASYAKLLLK